MVSLFGLCFNLNFISCIIFDLQLSEIFSYDAYKLVVISECCLIYCILWVLCHVVWWSEWYNDLIFWHFYDEEFTHYKFKNFMLNKTAMNSINISEYKIYTFYIYLSLTSHRLSNFIIQFSAARPNDQLRKFSVSFSGSHPLKLSVFTIINP